MKMKKQLIHATEVLAFLLTLPSMAILSVGAQEIAAKHVIYANENTQYYQGPVHDLAWLEGSWQGVGLGGICQETWDKPTGDTMMGMFKLIKEGKPVFYEFFVLLKKEDHIELRLKHFTPDFVAWESKDDFITFKLIKVEGHKALFGGLTFEKVGDNQLQVYLALKHEDGSVTEELFKFEKQI